MHFFNRGTNSKTLAAGASDFGFGAVGGVNVGFHNAGECIMTPPFWQEALF